MFQLLNEQNKVDNAYAKCHSQIMKLRSFIQQKRTDRNHNDSQLLTTVLSASPSSPSKRIPNLRCSAKIQRHFGKIYALYWFPDSSKLVTAAQDGKLLVSDANSTRNRFSIALKSHWIMTCSVSTTGKYIASGGLDNIVAVFDVSDISQYDVVAYDHQTIKNVEIMEHDGYISATQFIDDNRIISVSGDCTAKILDLNKQKCVKVFNYPGDIECVDINPQKSVFLSGCIDSCIYLDDYRTKSSSQHVGKYIGHQTDINGVKWFPDHMSFVSGSDDSTARLWDIRSYEQMNVYQDNNIFSTVTSVDVSHSGYYIFVGYDEDPFCVAWNTLTANREQTLQHDHRVSCLQMSPNGLALATGSWDRITRIWSTSARKSIFDNMTTCETCMCCCAICAFWCMDPCSHCKCCN